MHSLRFLLNQPPPAHDKPRDGLAGLRWRRQGCKWNLTEMRGLSSNVSTHLSSLVDAMGGCSFPGCLREVKKGRYCDACYQRSSRMKKHFSSLAVSMKTTHNG